MIAALPPANGLSSWGRTFSSLQDLHFRRLWTGMLLSMAGVQMMNIAQPWLAYKLSGSGVVLGAVSAATGVALFIVAPIAGVIVDRYEKRKILMVTQTSLATSTLLIAVLIQLDVIEVWHVALVAFLQGATFPFNMTARQAYIPELVRGDRLPNALALDSSGMQLNRMVAPGLGGILLAWNPTIAFTVTGVAYVAALYPLLRLPPGRNIQKGAETGMVSEVLMGINYVLGKRELLTLMLVAAAVGILGLPYLQFLPVFQSDVLHVSTFSLGLMFTATGVGALVGSLFAAYLADSPARNKLLLVAGVGLGVSLALFALSTVFVLSLLLLALVGFMQQGYLTSNRMAVVLNTERAYYGRVLSLYFVTFSLTSIGALPIGVLVDAVGAPATMTSIGLLLAAIMLAAGAFLPRGRTAEPALSVGQP